MGLIKQFHVSTNAPQKDMGSAIPKWYGGNNYQSISNWWGDGGTANYFYSENSDNCYIQYGQNSQIWASARFFVQSVTLDSVTEHEDGSISYEASVTLVSFQGKQTNYSTGIGYNVNYNILIDGKNVFSKSMSTVTELNEKPNKTIKVSDTIPPQKRSTKTLLTLDVIYPNGEFSNSKTQIGISLFNNNPLTYVPHAVNHSGVIKPLNSNKMTIQLNDNGTIKDVGKEETPNANKINSGKNRINNNGNQYQLPVYK